jgi:hypothetical protein
VVQLSGLVAKGVANPPPVVAAQGLGRHGWPQATVAMWRIRSMHLQL